MKKRSEIWRVIFFKNKYVKFNSFMTTDEESAKMIKRFVSDERKTVNRTATTTCAAALNKKLAEYLTEDEKNVCGMQPV